MKLEFTIDGETYRVPDYITVAKFERAILWDLDNLQNLKPFVATIVDCPLSHINRLDEEVLAFITGVCLQRMQVQDSPLETRIGLNDLLDFDTMTFGQWIDLDTFFAKGVGRHLSQIVGVLYDQSPEAVSEWDVTWVWGAINQFAVWRESVYREHDEFFELREPEDVGEVEEDRDPNIGLMWYEATLALADEDFLKIHQVVERPYKECLNYLTWKKAKAQREQLEILKRKHDLQRRIR
jgi:hypothetical protein